MSYKLAMKWYLMRMCASCLCPTLVPRGRAPFGQRQESRPLASNTRSPRFTNFPSLCACSESSLTNLIGSGLNLLCFQSHSKPERLTWPEVGILGANQKERGLWGREWLYPFKIGDQEVKFNSLRDWQTKCIIWCYCSLNTFHLNGRTLEFVQRLLN